MTWCWLVSWFVSRDCAWRDYHKGIKQIDGTRMYLRCIHCSCETSGIRADRPEPRPTPATTDNERQRNDRESKRRKTMRTMKTTALTMVALMMLASTASATPITFGWDAGRITGQYTFDTEAQGVRQMELDDDGLPIEGEMLYANAITAFLINVAPPSGWGGGDWTFSGNSGNLGLALTRGHWGETWYSADMAAGNDYQFRLALFSAAGESFIASERLGDVVLPDLSAPGLDLQAELRDAHTGQAIAQSQVSRIWRVGGDNQSKTTKVPEGGTTALMLFVSLAAMFTTQRVTRKAVQ